VSDSVKTRLTTVAAPYGREVRLDEVAYASGMKLLRVTIREGARYTVIELDATAAIEWADAMRRWAKGDSPVAN
jgi:hypothetical protein